MTQALLRCGRLKQRGATLFYSNKLWHGKIQDDAPLCAAPNVGESSNADAGGRCAVCR